MDSFIVGAASEESVISILISPVVLLFAGAEVTDTNGTVASNIPGGNGFPISETSNFSFDFDEDTGLTSTSGSIDSTGSLTLSSAADTPFGLTFGGFSLSFDATRMETLPGASGFFVADTIATNTPIFDITTPGIIDIEDGNFQISNAQIILAPEFADLLIETEVISPTFLPLLVGQEVGSIQVDAAVTEVEIESDGSPAFASSATVDVLENQTLVIDLEATDDDSSEGAGLTFELVGGADLSLFSLDPISGLLSFVSAPDFEMPGDADGDNIFEVEVAVSDGVNPPVTQALSATVIDDPTDNSDVAPTFTSPAAVTFLENVMAAITVTAADANGDELFFSIAGGADQDAFSLDPLSGALTLLTATDFEMPGDANGDNVFEVEVAVTDEISNPVTQLLAITVANSFEAASEFTLDVDSNGNTDSLTDGLNVLRVLLGAPEQSIVLGEGSPNGLTPETLSNGLDLAIADSVLDVDRSGSTDALADGLNILRVLLGAPVQSIVLGATAPPDVTQQDVVDAIDALS